MLKVIYSNTLSQLAAQLADVQRLNPLPPFEPETIIVQSNELSRWLSLVLAQQHGIAANLIFPFPSAYIWQLFRQIWPEVPLNSPYSKDPLTWRIYVLLPDICQQTGFEAVKRYLGEEDEPLRRYELASRIADTFDQYLMYRPDWVQAWEQGGAATWQGQLWYQLTQADPQPMHRARLLTQLHALLAEQPSITAKLPKRLSIFGISALPPVYLSIFEQMAKHGDITLYFLSPSEHFWGDLITPKQLSRQQLQLNLDDVLPDESHALLGSLGKQGQAFFQQLQDIEHAAETQFEAPNAEHLLGYLQADIYDLAPAATPIEVADGDDSIAVHVCHSAMREIEVLQDQLLALFDANPDLTPTDIVVMTPDIHVYAPWIEAVFGTAPVERRFPFSIADNTSETEHPSLNAWLQLLTLPQSRFEVDSVLALLSCPAIQQRFDLDDAAVEWCRQWCIETRIHWAVDAQDKADLDLPMTVQNTWQAGLSRLFLGYAMPLTEENQPWRLFENQLPVDGINSERARLVAQLARLIQQLEHWRNRLKASHTVAVWQTELNLCLDAFFAETDDHQDTQVLLLIRAQLAKLVESAEQATSTEKISLEVVNSWLMAHQEPLDGTSQFLGHGVTFCGMVPMRSIPFEVICLIGMNDAVFPRQQPKVGFDLLAQDHRRGDRSRREDDRYLFLEALISAQSKLYLSYVGSSQLNNADIPPSVLVSDLLDYIDEHFVTTADEKVSKQITTHHPLQAFSPRYFSGKEAKLFSYQAQHCPENRPLANMNWFAEPLPAAEPEWRTVSLSQLIRFFQHPLRFLCQERLDIRFDIETSALESREPFSLDGLEAWQLRQTLLDTRLQGQTTAHAADVIHAMGMLPQGEIGEQWLEQSAVKVDNFLTTLSPYIDDVAYQAQSFEVHLSEFTLMGQLPRVNAQGQLIYRMSKFKSKDILSAWLMHLVLNITATNDIARNTVLVMEDKTIGFSPVIDAESILLDLLNLYWQGLQQPLPFYLNSSYAYAIQQWDDKPEKAVSAVEKSWVGNQFVSGEGNDPYYQRLGCKVPTDEVFTALAMQVYEPIFRHLTEDNL